MRQEVMSPTTRRFQTNQHTMTPALPGYAAFFRRFALGLLLLALSRASVIAQESEAEQRNVINREYAIKAAYLYHFLTYVQWPPEMRPTETQPFVIGVYRDNPFGSALKKIAEIKTVDGRPIDIRRVTTSDEARHCEILFVPRSVPHEQQNAILRALRGWPILVVGESEGFVTRGGDVQFFLQGNKVRFAFNANLTKQETLKVSSKLLSLAEIIPDR